MKPSLPIVVFEAVMVFAVIAFTYLLFINIAIR